LKKLLESVVEASRGLSSGEVAVVGDGVFGESGTVTIGATPLAVKTRIQLERNKIKDILSRLGGLAGELLARLVVSSAQDGPVLVDKALLRVTRVALRRDRKTVATGALWTEEYLPYGTVFLTAVIDTGFTNEYCKEIGVNDAQAALDALKTEVLKATNGVFYVIVGGKETVGKGLIKFVAL